MSDSARKICPRAALGDGGAGARFEIERGGQRLAGIAIAFAGEVFAYRNHCPHRGTELDWQPGEVFDESGLYLICATHGAVFDPSSGKCLDGPCRGDSLDRIPVVVENHFVVLETDVLLAPPAPGNAGDRGP